MINTTSKLVMIRNHIHQMIDSILNVDYVATSPKMFSTQIALQYYISILDLSCEEIAEYMLDNEVSRYMGRYQRFSAINEMQLERVMSDLLSNQKSNNEVIQCIRSFYPLVYQTISKNEIVLSTMNPASRVCMVGAGSMPLSLLFAHRYSGASIVGIDIEQSAVDAGEEFIEYIARTKPDVYSRKALDLYCSPGESFEYEGYQVVILSIHIKNKTKVIKRILETAPDHDDLIIIDRQALGLSQYFYKNHSINLDDCDISSSGSLKSGVITSQAFVRTQGKFRGDV